MPVNQKNNFMEMVAKMRENQKEYFKKRDHFSLIEAKKYEAIVDKLLREHAAAEAEQQQGRLF